MIRIFADTPTERLFRDGVWRACTCDRDRHPADTEIIAGRRSISADTAIRLGRYFDTDPRFWLNLQAAHDLSKAEAENDYSGVPTRAA